jgi:hypothetical protein
MLGLAGEGCAQFRGSGGKVQREGEELSVWPAFQRATPAWPRPQQGRSRGDGPSVFSLGRRDFCRSTFYEGSPLTYRIVGIVLAVAVIEALRLDDNWGMDGKFTKGFKQTDFGKTDSL